MNELQVFKGCRRKTLKDTIDGLITSLLFGTEWLMHDIVQYHTMRQCNHALDLEIAIFQYSDTIQIDEYIRRKSLEYYELYS